MRRAISCSSSVRPAGAFAGRRSAPIVSQPERSRPAGEARLELGELDLGPGQWRCGKRRYEARSLRRALGFGLDRRPALDVQLRRKCLREAPSVRPAPGGELSFGALERDELDPARRRAVICVDELGRHGSGLRPGLAASEYAICSRALILEKSGLAAGAGAARARSCSANKR